LNRDSLDLCLLSNQDYRREPSGPGDELFLEYTDTLSKVIHLPLVKRWWNLTQCVFQEKTYKQDSNTPLKYENTLILKKTEVIPFYWL
jgi:hypothetical protein